MTIPDLDRAIQAIRSHAGDKAGEWPEKAAIAVIESLLLDPSEGAVEAAAMEIQRQLGVEHSREAWPADLARKTLRAAGLHYLGRTG